MGIEAIVWNIGLGIVASAAWEAIKHVFARVVARRANKDVRGARIMPFVRNAPIFSVIFIVMTFVAAMYSPLHFIL